MNDDTLSLVLCLECESELPLYLLTSDGFGLTGYCPHCRMPIVLPRRRLTTHTSEKDDLRG